MNKDLQRVDSVENTSQPRIKPCGEQRQSKRSSSIRNNRMVARNCNFNQLNGRFNKYLAAINARDMKRASSLHSLLERKGLIPAKTVPIQSGSVVISIMDGELRVMDGARCMYKQQVSYKSLPYARSVKADSLVTPSGDSKPFGFVSSVFDDNGPVCFWRTLKFNDTVFLVFWGNHEQK